MREYFTHGSVQSQWWQQQTIFMKTEWCSCLCCRLALRVFVFESRWGHKFLYLRFYELFSALDSGIYPSRAENTEFKVTFSDLNILVKWETFHHLHDKILLDACNTSWILLKHFGKRWEAIDTEKWQWFLYYSNFFLINNSSQR